MVEIGSVVSEKIFKIFHPPFFLFLAWRPSWLEVGITGHNFGRGPSILLYYDNKQENSINSCMVYGHYTNQIVYDNEQLTFSTTIK
jgi:hypothetical protein